MRPIFSILSLLFISVLFTLESRAQNREEFNGPLSGWADVKKRFGANGNGKDDDTRAIQKALDNLSNLVTNFNMGKDAYTVLYLPAGTYCISSTLVLRGKIGVNIIGEDPHNTIIKWVGKSQDTMFWSNGSAYYRIARFTWDANGRKDMEAIGIHWKEIWNDGKTQSFASLNNEVSDCFFKGKFKYGISGGTYTSGGTGANDSEITIKRCVFEGCTAAGIYIQGYNALDYWIWDCQFIKCQVGVDNHHGNYHVYRSFFSGTVYSSVHNDNGYYTSVRGCYSENSEAFSLDAGVSSNPFKRIFQDNVMVGLKGFSIQYYHMGKITLWNNSIAKPQDTTLKFIAGTGSWTPGIYETMSIGNTYEVKTPIRNLLNPYKVFQSADNYIPKIKTSAAAFISTIDPIPQKKSRRVFEVPAGADSRTIQSIIDQAAALKGQRPVVHFRVGTYSLDKTLVIPEGSDMQLTGDGLLYASIIVRSGSGDIKNAPLLIVKGPSYISIRDLQFVNQPDKELSAVIQFLNTDQPSSEVHVDQLNSSSDTSLVSDKLDHLYIEKNNSFFSDGSYLVGGPLTKQGKGSAKVCFFGGQFARLFVNDGARFSGKDCWYEGKTRTPIDLKGSGEVTLDGALIAPGGSQDSTKPSIWIKEFNGKVCLLNMYVHGPLVVNPGNSKLDFLLWNINFLHKHNIYEYVHPGTSARIALMGGNAQCIKASEGCKDILSIPDRFYRVNDEPEFLKTMTSFGRTSRPVHYRNLPAGVSNIYLSRVSLGTARRGLVFGK